MVNESLGTVLLNLHCACKPPWDLVKMQILIQEVCDGARDSIFTISTLVMSTLLVSPRGGGEKMKLSW